MLRPPEPYKGKGYQVSGRVYQAQSRQSRRFGGWKVINRGIEDVEQAFRHRRQRRKIRVRKKVRGTDLRPRVCVFRSNKHIYAQVISDSEGKTLATVSTLSEDLAEQLKKAKAVNAAKQVGVALAKVCQEKNISRVVFDRNGFIYHGRVKAVADGAREGGLDF
jgi:large subunit ribosomal protein L18